jgi:hypothetical protein
MAKLKSCGTLNFYIMKQMKKYQTGSEVKGSKGSKASQIIAGISGAVAGAAGIAKNISNKRKAKKAAEEKAKMEAEGKMKTGGMVNSNKKVSALKSAGSKGVKSGVNPNAAAQKFPKGRSGGTSTAPKGAVPKAQMGGTMHPMPADMTNMKLRKIRREAKKNAKAEVKRIKNS